MRRVLAWLRERYLKVDPRWLGVFRIALGTLLTVDVARRWYYARAFYTNEGLLPNHFALFRPMGRNVFSIFFPFSTYAEVSVLFALSLVATLLFTIGYRTKLFHVLSAIVITSLNARNIFVENGGTVVVNLLTVWTLFLPLGRRLSLDAVRHSLADVVETNPAELADRSLGAPSVRPFASIVVLVLILQWTFVYFFNAVHKSGEGWMNGSAIHWFWHQDRIVTWLAIWARNHVPFALVKGMTWGTLAIEFTLGFILLIPFWQTWTRRIALVLAIVLHGGIAASSRLGPFSYVMCIFFLILLGERDWQLAARWFGRPARARTVVYDVDCGICFQICRILKRLDPFERLEFVPNSARERIPESVSDETLDKTVVCLLPDGTVATEERAVYEIVRALPLGILAVFWIRVPGLSLVARSLYRRVAENRVRISTWFGLTACGLSPVPAVAPASAPAPAPAPAPEIEAEAEVEPDVERQAEAEPSADSDETEEEPPAPERETRPSDGVLVWYGPERLEPPVRREAASSLAFARELVVAMLALAAATQLLMENRFVHKFFRAKQPEWASLVVNYPRMFQGWGMFAPEPPYDDGHVVVDGRTVDGRKLDPLTGKEPHFDPHAPNGWGHEQFWCDYENRIRFPGNAGYRPWFKDYLLRHHERTGNPKDRLVAFDVWWVHDKSPPPGQSRGEPLPPQKILSHGFVSDSGATPWLSPGRAR